LIGTISINIKRGPNLGCNQNPGGGPGVTITVHVHQADDGFWETNSDNLPGLILSHRDPDRLTAAIPLSWRS
jgi:hypothetical protein